MTSCVERHVRLVSAFVLLLLVARPAAAQILRGTVVEQGTGTPLEGVVVSLLTESGDSVTAAISDARGRVDLVAPRTGRYRLRAQRLGYITTENAVVDLDAGFEVVVTLTMSTSAIPLDPLRVESRSIPLHAPFAEIQERMRQGFGRFITRDDIEVRPGAHVPDLLHNIPGARVVNAGYGDHVVQFRARATLFDAPKPVGPETRELAFAIANQCPVKLYVDGVAWVRDHQVRSDDPEAYRKYREFMEISGADIEVIEVYSGPASVPSVYGGSDAECGVVAVWLRRTEEQQVFGPQVAPPPTGLFRIPRVGLGLSGYDVSGPNAPRRGVAVEASAQWSLTRSVALTLFARRSGHSLSAEAAVALTSTLSNTEYVLPPRSRALAVWTAGVEPRLQLRPASRVRPVLGARLEFAQRRFDLQSANVGNREIPVISYGWGVGLSAGVEAALTRRLSGYAAVGQEWLSFGSYREIERPWNETAATWRATSFRVGIAYDFTARSP